MPTTLPHDGPDGGFTALPRRVLDLLLCLSLTRRELSVLLLVARLTYGCRGAAWARLSQADLAAVGIGANHAGEVLRSLLGRGLLQRNGNAPEYRLGGLERAEHEASGARIRRLDALVARQLRPPSQNGSPMLPETGGRAFPKREVSPSRNGNPSGVVPWRFDPSRSRFVCQDAARIDNDR